VDQLTIHNLFELVLVRDLCGTFCFSMQFVVFMELVGTLVLPAAISFTLYILVLAILPTHLIPGGQKPIISLILLAFILGLPGVLIVITSRKVAYIGWMLIYLLSLPIWNLVLPAYAFWHMDDFSWGETRKIEGGDGDKGHGDKEGEFDSSHIVMKRWVEFERERRWKTGTQSRDSYYDVVQRSSSPRSRDGLARDRYSMVSTNETYLSGGAVSDSANAPLYRPSQSFASSMSTGGVDQPPLLDLPSGVFSGQRGPFRGRDASPVSTDSAGHTPPEDERWDPRHTPSSRSIPSMGDEMYGGPRYSSGYIDEEQPILSGGLSNPASPDAMYAPPQLPPVAGSAPRRYPDATDYSGGRQAMPSAGSGYDLGAAGRHTETDEDYVQQFASPPERRHSRGVSLKDEGAVQGAQPVRRVAKQSTKRASQSSISNNLAVFPNQSQQSQSQSHSQQQQGRANVSSPPTRYSGLPPGAAPAQTGRYY